ncbi:hypothetical protein BJ917_1529 [Pseudomonas sp. WPR_5_2]|uniref:hypothetical protein n=1 Tax=Pseudomonas sp. WPR_5_2 TaxID=1907371 RepID=UPI000EB4F9FB|nr:hypothetical protein [Pseudomonas sp. WPR_5_2]RKS28633.1 hypothetical protein BJ917_1529 [Pseudomonas sp. WPR_5_2]
MKTIATYSFLPWLRQGVANTIASADHDPAVKTRATIDVNLTLAGDPIAGGAELTATISNKVALYGPGDIVGIEQRAIVRTEPRNWITNFEANYIPAIDFYDEDFPWRYTPAASDGTGLRLRPWIALVVLAESEFKDATNIQNRPLPCIEVPDAKVFPPADDLWAWAHVHFNQSLSGDPSTLVSPDMSAVLPRVESIIAANPDLAYSRIMCPRRLAPQTAYHAFLMPVFETGRLAGLGSDPNAAPHATFSAWATYAGRREPAFYPFYYRFYFRTASQGDFEYLVRLLKPQLVDPKVGMRDMDVQAPGSNIPGITDPALHGVLKLGGALRVPDADLNADQLADRHKYENWAQPYPVKFQIDLAKFINLPDDYASQTAADANTTSGLVPAGGDPDPLITAPLYGRWHSLTNRVLLNRDGTAARNNTNWVHCLNLDPRFRVPAGFGGDVVETNAEEYMNYAWEQIGDVLAANSKIRRLQLAKEVSWRWHVASLQPLATANFERAFAVTGPVASRVLASPNTVAYTQSLSMVPPVYTSALMRRVMRPGSRLIRNLPFTAAITPHNLLVRVNNGEVSPAPPVVVPPGVPTVDQTTGAAAPTNIPSWLENLLRQFPWLPTAAVIIAFLLALFLLLIPIVGILMAAALIIGGIWLYRYLKNVQKAMAATQSIQQSNQTPTAVAQLPQSPDFTLQQPGSAVRPTTGTSDSPTAVRFKNALFDSFTLITTTRTVSARPDPIRLELSELTSKMVAAVDPQVTIPRRALSYLSIPKWILDLLSDQFGEVMAYPTIDLPMYMPLKAISAELFLPNINLIPPNSITLIETNQRFIEAYMVGLNHEFARKLLWREYPTDQRGSYFRQFWDPRTYFDTTGLTPEQLKDKLYDIPKLHRWSLTSNLGDHNNRARPGQKGEDAVLVIRGELLKRYPTAVIYAHHAQWERTPDGRIDLSKPRTLQDIDAALREHPPPSIIRMPLYEAKVDPDIYFFGFDLTVPEAKGGPGTNPADDPGWFFVIKERPGEPRFGLEINKTSRPELFDELTWDDAVPDVAAGAFLPAGVLNAVPLASPPAGDPEGKGPQHSDDLKVNGAAISSARWAYLLFRAPVMVAVHADEMLRSGS